MNAELPPLRHQIAGRLNDACCRGLAAMHTGAAMMRLESNPYLAPARTGLIVIALILVGVIIGRVITVLEHSDVRTHTAGENGGGPLPDVGVANLRGSLP